MPTFFCWSGPVKVEASYVGPRVDLAAAHLERVVAAGDFLVHGLVGGQRVAVLIDVAQLDRVADLQLAAVGLFLADDHAEQRGLAGAVGADDADDAARRQSEDEVLDQHAVAVALAELLGLDDERRRDACRAGSGSRTPRSCSWNFSLASLFVRGDAGLALGLAGLGGDANPLQLAGECFLASGFLFFFDLPAGRFFCSSHEE